MSSPLMTRALLRGVRAAGGEARPREERAGLSPDAGALPQARVEHV